MKKAVIIGGSNGIGLSLSTKLIQKGYDILIMDKAEPDKSVLDSELTYKFCDLLDFDSELFSTIALESDLEILIITAGIGKIADFEYHHLAEIDKIITTNTISIIKLLRIFYDRIKSKNSFYCCVLSSIAGNLSSPSSSVYSASKASINRLIESVNIELEESRTNNRILNVCPFSFKGSKFHGDKNDLSLLSDISDEILINLFNRETFLIPQYDETLKDVIDRYRNNPHEFGLQSYRYKRETSRLQNNKNVIIGYLSGTFDLFHVGHLNILRKAKQNCDYLIVGVHSDGKWKKKDTFIPFDERKEIVGSCKYVDKVVDACLEDSDAWNIWHYDKLFVGSDYKGSQRFSRYEDFFSDKNVEIVYFPYTKDTSSTMIREAIINDERHSKH